MKVLVIDDEPDLREIMRIAFQRHWPGAEVLSRGLGSAGLDAAGVESPDLVILDIALPDMDGMELIEPLRKTTGAPVMVLTARSSEADKVRGLERGADDYMTKPFDAAELLARCRAVLRRYAASETRRAGPTYRKGPMCVDFGTGRLALGDSRLQLAPVESSLLYHLVMNSGRAVPYKTLLAKVWGREYVRELDFLRLQVERLRRKIEREPHDPRIITQEAGVGYKFVGPVS